MNELVSVKEHLPEIHRDVLVYCSGTRGQFVASLTEEGQFEYEGGQVSVTHWMKLPEEPKS